MTLGGSLGSCLPAGGGSQPSPGAGLCQGHWAAVLAHFAEAVRPPLRPLRDAETQALNSLVARRQQVMTMLVAERNRLSSAAMAVRPSIEAHIAWLKQELDDLDQGLRQTLRQSPLWREKDDLLRSVPGIGDQISLTLLACLPELGTLNRRQIAALEIRPETPNLPKPLIFDRRLSL